MLTPLELQNKRISTNKRKYDKAEIDEYFDLLFEHYKSLYDEYEEQKKQIKTLSDGIQYYRSIESTMQKALILAEKTSKETKDAAILKAEAIEKDANKKAEKIINEAESEYDRIRDKCVALVQQFNQYKLQLEQAATAQLNLITGETFDVMTPEIEGREIKEPSDADGFDVSDTNITNDVKEKPHKVGAVPLNTHPLPNLKGKLDLESQNESNDDLSLEVDSKSSFVPVTDKTTVVPDIKDELKKPTKKISDDADTLSILSADTIDLGDSINQARYKEDMGKITRPIDAKPKSVTPAKVSEPVKVHDTPFTKEEKVIRDAGSGMIPPKTIPQPDTIEVLEPAPAVTNNEPEILQIEPEPISKKPTQTLDSLLQSMNITGKGKKSKKENDTEDDPFEFLGSVDDF